ncbi:MAG: hypothetical protein IJ899_21440 [Blautia sp.]|nr:hypothetical protein [Blautia sp.]
MEKWTKEELEELFQKANQKAKEDGEFRKEARQDVKAALEKLADRKLPEGFQLEMVEPGELGDEAAEKVTGGLNLIICSTYDEQCPELFCHAWGCPGYVYKPPCTTYSCGAAGPCPLYSCAADCGGYFCMAEACATKV